VLSARATFESYAIGRERRIARAAFAARAISAPRVFGAKPKTRLP